MELYKETDKIWQKEIKHEIKYEGRVKHVYNCKFSSSSVSESAGVEISCAHGVVLRKLESEFSAVRLGWDLGIKGSASGFNFMFCENLVTLFGALHASLIC